MKTLVEKVCPTCGKKKLRLPKDRVKTSGKYATNVNWQEWVLRRIKEEAEKRQDPPPDAVWVRTGGIYPGFLLRPEEAERLDAVIQRRNQLNDMETRTPPPICEPTQ
ncbi:MAG: hypothetical protein Q4D62_08030 [Planctomycetia bacterium]|nr:hypothetical protein [Planctomycetia bacterium]